MRCEEHVRTEQESPPLVHNPAPARNPAVTNVDTNMETPARRSSPVHLLESSRELTDWPVEKVYEINPAARIPESTQQEQKAFIATEAPHLAARAFEPQRDLHQPEQLPKLSEAKPEEGPASEVTPTRDPAATR